IHVQQPVGYLSFRHFHHLKIKGRKGWIFKASQVRQLLGLHTSSVCLNTSASRWSAGLSQHMSRVRNTLDTVSKAVSGTHTELLSKISRLKPKAVKAQKQSETSVESTLKAEEKAITSTLAPTASATSNPSAHTDLSTSAATSDVRTTTFTPLAGSAQMTVTSAVVTVRDVGNKKLRRVAPTVKACSHKKPEELPAPLNTTENKTTTSKETPGLFHPSTLSANLDETYNYLSHHINSYFGSRAKTQSQKGDEVDNNRPLSQPQQPSNLVPVSDKADPTAPVTPPSSKKSLGQYLSYSAPTVQAFVGNYIAPLVPKFRPVESKSTATEEKKPEGVTLKQIEGPISKEQTAAEEKARKLLLQREKVARVSVDNRTRALVQALHRASDVRVYISRVEDLSYHLLEFPETRGVAVKSVNSTSLLPLLTAGVYFHVCQEKVIPCLLRLEQANDPGLRSAVREALALVAAVSTIVNQGLPLKAHVFRNYNLLPGVRSHYLGGCQHQLWQAIRATSAAPGYFQEFKLGNDLHQAFHKGSYGMRGMARRTQFSFRLVTMTSVEAMERNVESVLCPSLPAFGRRH
ncbi:hypothetical protein GOODEAATRI_000015, partial [Goodea atripinnis]